MKDREVVQCFSEHQKDQQSFITRQMIINVFNWRLIVIVAYCLEILQYPAIYKCPETLIISYLTKKSC